MDSLTVKLIDRKLLTKQNLTFSELVVALQTQNNDLVDKNILSAKEALKWEILYNKEVSINRLLYENVEDQKEITIEVKRQARKNGLYLFGGGLAVGIIAVGLLL